MADNVILGVVNPQKTGSGHSVGRIDRQAVRLTRLDVGIGEPGPDDCVRRTQEHSPGHRGVLVVKLDLVTSHQFQGRAELGVPGNADPRALVLASAAFQICELIGLPEGRIPLAQAAVYVACAPKSNAAYQGIDKALDDVKSKKAQNVPNHLKDASYPGAKTLGHGKDYNMLTIMTIIT